MPKGDEDAKEQRVDKLYLKFGVLIYMKSIISDRFGIAMSDNGDKQWTLGNLLLMNESLGSINRAVGGTLKSLAGGTVIKLYNQDPIKGEYHGSTHLDGRGIDFYTIGDAALRQMNIFHEFGHLIDNVPGYKDWFTNAVGNLSNPTWIKDDIISPDALKFLTIYNDPNYSFVQARQAFSDLGPSEQWADAFANYVACNINLTNPAGIDMYKFVTNSLSD